MRILYVSITNEANNDQRMHVPSFTRVRPNWRGRGGDGEQGRKDNGRYEPLHTGKFVSFDGVVSLALGFRRLVGWKKEAEEQGEGKCIFGKRDQKGFCLPLGMMVSSL